jgi:3-methyl-2-oxobutanoate hydroxymethyltransferase
MMNIHDFQKKRNDNIKITMVTCYDYWSAKILAKTDIDCILVGDSLVMVMHGASTTIPATVDLMCIHTTAVSRGAENKFIIGDLPFGSYRQGIPVAMHAITRIMQAGAHAIKLEGGIENEALIKHVVASGIPVMGHIGLTPQSIHQLGGYKIQGKTKNGAQLLLEQALVLEQAGCFAIVLECLPSQLAARITEKLTIPTIGIGAGPDVGGQVLVLQDLLGLYEIEGTQPKFIKTYLKGQSLIERAVNEYLTEVKTSKFPSVEHCYKMENE